MRTVRGRGGRTNARQGKGLRRPRVGDPWIGILARGWISGLRLQAHDFGADAGEAINCRDGTMVRAVAGSIACGANKQEAINQRPSPQPRARVPFQRELSG